LDDDDIFHGRRLTMSISKEVAISGDASG